MIVYSGLYNMLKIIFPLILFASLFLHSKETRPNFVFILVDDLGKMDMSCEGSTFHETPNIDRLAGVSMRCGFMATYGLTVDSHNAQFMSRLMERWLARHQNPWNETEQHNRP